MCGLGNRLVTSDSLGPAVTDKLYPTVALEEYDTKIFLLSPGAEGQNGFSTFDNVKSAVELSECELLIVIDSLCARSPERLSATIQLSSTGILPGSGVGNHKKEISKETLSVPVISIGVPTVSELKVLSEGEDIFFLSPSDIDLCISSFADILASSIEKIFYRKRT